MLFYLFFLLIPLFIIAVLLYLFFASQKRKSKAVARVEDSDLGGEKVVSPNTRNLHQERAVDPEH